MTATSTLAEYRNLYKVRHGIECPLSDAQIKAAAATATVGLDVYPLSLDVLTEMEATVASEFPSVEQSRYQMTGTFSMPQDLALDNATAVGFDANFSLPTGGNPPYSIQLYVAPDDTGAPGEYTAFGTAQADADEIVVTGLDAETAYWAKVIVSDHLGESAESNEETITTAAA